MGETETGGDVDGRESRKKQNDERGGKCKSGKSGLILFLWKGNC